MRCLDRLLLVKELRKWPSELLNVVSDFRGIFRYSFIYRGLVRELKEGKIHTTLYPRIQQGRVIVLGAFTYLLDIGRKQFKKWHLVTGVCTTLRWSDPLIVLYATEFCSIGLNLYLHGYVGVDAQPATSTYDTETDTWTMIPDSRRYYNLVSLGTLLIGAALYNDYYLDTSSSTSKWHEMTPRTPRYLEARMVAVDDENLLCIDGCYSCIYSSRGSKWKDLIDQLLTNGEDRLAFDCDTEHIYLISSRDASLKLFYRHVSSSTWN